MKYNASSSGYLLEIQHVTVQVGWGLESQKLEAKYEAKLDFPGRGGEGGCKKKTFHGRSMNVLWNC